MPVETLSLHAVYVGWGTYSVASFRTENGDTVEREIEDHGHGACVFAYDPERRVAMLVRQFRAPVFLMTKEPQLLEAIAGMVDEGKPDVAARREAREETGLGLGALEHVVTGWTSPGVSTERMDLFLARYRASDCTGDGGGVAHEQENVTAVEVPLRELAELADAGHLTDLKTLTLVQTLRLRQPALFAP